MTNYLCPVCRAPRETELRDHISAFAHLQLSLLVLFVAGLGYAISGLSVALKLILLYLPFWAAAEFLHWAKMREDAKCKVCHFDPVLYQKNPLEARRHVEARLNTAVDDLKGQLKQKSPTSQSASANSQEDSQKIARQALQKVSKTESSGRGTAGPVEIKNSKI